ncbi:MAG: hypothetical protein ACI934_002194 [Pseudohongiellaceae bacterium]|jgi:hypothetical protein
MQQSALEQIQKRVINDTLNNVPGGFVRKTRDHDHREKETIYLNWNRAIGEITTQTLQTRHLSSARQESGVLFLHVILAALTNAALDESDGQYDSQDCRSQH